MDEFDESHVDLALAPWHFTSMPGINAAHWPDGLESFVTRLEELPPLALWAEPLDILPYGVEFVKNAQDFINKALENAAGAGQDSALLQEAAMTDLALSIRAFLGFAIKAGGNDTLVEGLSLLQQAEAVLP
jgi:hypothetical protein